MENAKDKDQTSGNTSPNSPHDKFFKVVFKRPQYTRELLEGRLPAALKSCLDLNTLRLSDTGRINTNLDEDFTDIQFCCDTREGGTVEIPVILEHKSYKPLYAPYQYMHYQDGIWGWQVQSKNFKPTPVIPIVVYHGAEKWQPDTWKSYLEGWDEAFAPFTPPGGCIFISLNDIPDEEIKHFQYGFMVAALLLMKHRLEREYLLQNLPVIFTFVESDPLEDNIENRITNIRYALRYLQGLKSIKWQEAKAQLYLLNLTWQTMDVLEEIKLEAYLEGREEGMEEGMEKGMEEGMEKEKFLACRNMLRNGFSEDVISGVLEITVTYVRNVQAQLEKETQVAAMIHSGSHDDMQIAAALEVSPYLAEAVRKGLGKKK